MHPPVWTLHWQHTHFFRNISKMYIKLFLRQYGLNMSPGMIWGSSRCCNIETTSLIKQSDHQLVVFHTHTHTQAGGSKEGSRSHYSFTHPSVSSSLIFIASHMLLILLAFLLHLSNFWQLQQVSDFCDISQLPLVYLRLAIVTICTICLNHKIKSRCLIAKKHNYILILYV
jgi:hypothetical protein